MAFENYRAGENAKRDAQHKRVQEALEKRMKEALLVETIRQRVAYIAKVQAVIAMAESLLPGRNTLTNEVVAQRMLHLKHAVRELEKSAETY